MLKFQLRHVVAYATRNKQILQTAGEDFFGKTVLDTKNTEIDLVTGLFNEWLIFDFRLPPGQTVSIDYFLKNPDGFSEDLMDELRQITETQHFDMFELQSLKRGKWMKIYGLFSGKTYTVYEQSGSRNAPSKGSFWGRVARVNNRYILVGSNPVYLPMKSTDRLKQFYLENKPEKFSPKDVLPILLPRKTKPSIIEKKQMTVKELLEKRKSIKTRYATLEEKYAFAISFEDIVEFVYNEEYKTNFGDFMTDLVKLGIPEKVLFSSFNVFNDIWNFFPHKKLQGKSPYELYKQTYG